MSLSSAEPHTFYQHRSFPQILCCGRIINNYINDQESTLSKPNPLITCRLKRTAHFKSTLMQWHENTFASYYHFVNWFKDLILDISGGLTGTQYVHNRAIEKKKWTSALTWREKHCQVEFYCSCHSMNVEKGRWRFGIYLGQVQVRR